MQVIDVIKSVALNLGDLVIDGVPASLTASTIDHLSLIQPQSNQLTGKYFYIYSGAAAGQSRVTGSFSPTNKRLSFPEAFGSVPSVNSNFLLTLKFGHSDYLNAVKRYIGIARIKYLQEKVATLALVATQYEYAVPSGFEFVNTLRIVPTGNTYYPDDIHSDAMFEIPPRCWRIERNVGGSYVIAVDSRKLNLNDLDNHVIKVMGQAKSDITGTDNANIPPELEEYLINGACMQLLSQPGGQENRLDPRFYMYRDILRGVGGNAGLEEYVFSYSRGKKVG